MRIKVVYRKLGKEKVYGWANSENNSIEIDERLKGKKQLEIILHEALHLLHPELEEEGIVRTSVVLTNLLWKQEYRKIDNENITPLQDGSL